MLLGEAEALQLWLDPPGQGGRDSSACGAQPLQTESNETRRFDFGVQAPKNAPTGPVRVPVYALYYACEDVQGMRRFPRQDLEIVVNGS